MKKKADKHITVSVGSFITRNLAGRPKILLNVAQKRRLAI
jgi:hypothetical protein